jgi:peptidase M28-like protein
MKRAPALLAVALLAAIEPASTQPRPTPTRIRADAIRSHMTFLADDLLEGRGTGTRGFELAAKYVAAQFEAAGLRPAGTDGGYYQRVHFRRTKPIGEQSSFALVRGDVSEPFIWGRDFVARSNAVDTRFIATAPIVFVGYGVSAPEYGHDDYADDVRGAIVAFLPDVPSTVPMDRRDYYTSVKWDLARQHGAIATIELSTPDTDNRWPWEDRMSWVTHGAATWLEPDGTVPDDALLPRVLLSSAGTVRLLGTVSRAVSDVIGARRPLRLPNAILNIAARHEEMSSPHVLAILPGSEPQRREEYVVYVAHLDGSGRDEPVAGDDIYNSAIDNGLGSAMLVTLAQAFGGLAERPNRSMIFLAATGEELGIVGSPYFVEHPTVPLDAIVAVINIDGPSLLTDSVNAVLAMGASNSSLGTVVDAAARLLRLKVNKAAAPLNYSDHFPFVMKGIPALWIVGSGNESTEANATAQRRIHTPADDMNWPFRWDVAETLAQLNFQIGQRIANQPERPRWNANDILGEKFDRPRAR